MPFDEKDESKVNPWPFRTYSSKVGFRKHRLPVQDDTFNLERHERLLSQGFLKITENPDSKCIFIDKRVSGAKGSGFGTAAMRHVVQRSFALGYEGHVKNSASWSSHIFHLFMGMIPSHAFDEPGGRNWHVYFNFGLSGENALEDLKKCKNETDLLQLDASDRKMFAKILRARGKISKELKDITVQDILGHKEYLLNYAHETSYMQDYFIPRLLDVLEENIGNKYPDTNSWWATEMVLSEEGRNRWHEAITNNKEFIPFKRYEHLRKYMTKEQITQLDEILVRAEERELLEMREFHKCHAGPVKLWSHAVDPTKCSESVECSKPIKDFICRI